MTPYSDRSWEIDSAGSKGTIFLSKGMAEEAGAVGRGRWGWGTGGLDADYDVAIYERSLEDNAL